MALVKPATAPPRSVRPATSARYGADTQPGIRFFLAAWAAELSEVVAARRAVTSAAGAAPDARSAFSDAAACDTIVRFVTTTWSWPLAPVLRQDTSWLGQLVDDQGAVVGAEVAAEDRAGAEVGAEPRAEAAAEDRAEVEALAAAAAEDGVASVFAGALTSLDSDARLL